jgi:glycosyltransferase involved in cell wall biosynthesis
MTAPHRTPDGRVSRDGTWVVIPAFREERTIGAVVAALVEAGWRVVVVDDGSEDRTASRARAAGATVLRHQVNLGQGAALATGFAYALARPAMTIVVTFDADGQHDPEDVAALVAPLLADDLDVTLGSRFLADASAVRMPGSRRALLRLATSLARATTGLALTDTHNGLRAFRREALARISLRQKRMAHASEIQSEVARLGLRYREVPVHVRYTAHSLAKGQRLIDAVSILWDLLLAKVR